MLLFKSEFWPGLRDGTITLTFRLWDTPRVRVGSNQRTHPVGVLRIDDVREVQVRDITEDEARRAGFADRDALVASLRAFAKGPLTPSTRVFRVELTRTGEIDRAPGAEDADLSEDDVLAIDAKLDAMDARSADGAWTRATLRLIAEHPHTVAVELAKRAGRERAPFKADVVKLKKLGLTESFEIGYDLTPRGRAYLDAVTRRGASKRPTRAPARSARDRGERATSRRR